MLHRRASEGNDMNQMNPIKRSVAMRNRLLGAVLVIAIAVAECSKSPEELLVESKNSMAAKDYLTAIITLKNLLQDDPNNLEARLLLARSSLVMADPLSAEKEERGALLFSLSAAAHHCHDFWFSHLGLPGSCLRPVETQACIRPRYPRPVP